MPLPKYVQTNAEFAIQFPGRRALGYPEKRLGIHIKTFPSGLVRVRILMVSRPGFNQNVDTFAGSFWEPASPENEAILKAAEAQEVR